MSWLNFVLTDPTSWTEGLKKISLLKYIYKYKKKANQNLIFMSYFSINTDDNLQNKSPWMETFFTLSSSPRRAHIHFTIPSIIEMFGGIWAMPSRETQTHQFTL